MTAYCERIARAYSKNPPTLPKPPQKMRLLDRVKVKQIPERPPPLPPLVPNIVSMGYPSLPMPGENGVKQHCKIMDMKIMDENMDVDYVDGKKERPKWTGIEDIIFAYSEYSKGMKSFHSFYRKLSINCCTIFYFYFFFFFFFSSRFRKSIGEENFDERNIKIGGTIEQLTFRDHSSRAEDIRTFIRENSS